MDHSKLWKILKEMGIPDHLTCFLRNLYAVQEATVKTGRVDAKKKKVQMNLFPRWNSCILA